ncbi:hypothetical protein PspS35_13275 [Pseudomonas sp. S35]|uniref:hypothetical protein n=1 Tax=Pseudomonas sp. S35 TaxID=1573719 RepID=UPI00132EA4CE|nr:hypothetical protein [Pseudomonas sp. S35]QHF44701.1 hypothetical protein PspS35_13275 [Pseudomonas sp. S35]
MTVSNLNLSNVGHLIDSVAIHIADQIAPQDKPKPQQPPSFPFNGVEYAAAPKSHNTMIPMPRIG